jgi:hypothetical protein
MSISTSTYDRAALSGRAVERDARALLGQVMGYVAVTVGFSALGAYLGRDLSGGAGLVFFIGTFAAIVGLNVAVARGREQLAIGCCSARPAARPRGRAGHRRLRRRRPVRPVAGGRRHRGVHRRARRVRLRHPPRPLAWARPLSGRCSA